MVGRSLRLVVTTAGSLVEACRLQLSTVEPRTIVGEKAIKHGFSPRQGLLEDLPVALDWIRRGAREPLPV